ncbi:MAG: DNA-directed RNA polymerase subunit beta [Deltaproteobacteria bacterium]|nr:DNA-directed RNA polymerase subunit beta [Deltaproteobacteria bacterium]
METSLANDYRVRKSFGKIKHIVEIPNLIEMQKQSYERFLQKEVDPDERVDKGLQGVFQGVFPIRDFSGTASLEFVRYSIGRAKYDVDECLQRGMTYEAPMKITVRLVVYDVDKDSGAKHIRDIKEQEIYFGTIPLMTDNGTFIVNGTERVVVSQLHRSPGIFFDHDKGKTHSSGKLLYSARIIPLRGSWIDLEFDPKDILYVRIDRRRKFPVTILLKALGYSADELLDYFYDSERVYLRKEGVAKLLDDEFLTGTRSPVDITHPKSGKVLAKKGRKLGVKLIQQLKDSKVSEIPFPDENLVGRVVARDVVDEKTGEVLIQCNEELTEEHLVTVRAQSIEHLDLLYMDGADVSPSFRNTLAIDKVEDSEAAILEIYRKLRPSNPPTPEVAAEFFKNLFFSPDHYDLSEVGRLKLNQQLETDLPLSHRTLTEDGIFRAVKKLIKIKDTQGAVDDIDNLGNRRVRAVGELLENQYRIGLVRMERAIKERMSLQEIETLMPHDLINAKPVSAVVKEFFGTSQLSQFMDQTNPLSEITHKRRLSALGPGGLTRERAGFEVRDVHPTHYGRICPIETPEGPNIGLIVSLSTYARVNEFGFIETPYREVAGGTVSNNVAYLSAMDEKKHAFAQANAPLDSKNKFVRDQVSCRLEGEFIVVSPDEVEFMDVSPNQLVSVAASLIPFLENDDANRALMGSNMQRQAVPLLKAKAPIVGTGIERVVAQDSGVAIIARRDGMVEDVDASRVVVRASDGDGDDQSLASAVDIYKITKFQRSNQNTCFNQKPIVRPGQRVKKGQIIADGPGTEMGELALGRNVTVAFMSWGGYNFEDSILVSERVVKEDVFTSIHIEEFELVARDTKLGKEEITRDIPNIGEEALGNLDESGIIRVGATIQTGDILVGKVTPKGETQLTPEEKLLRAIFGEKAGDVKDTSLRVPPGVEGIVIDAKVFSRRGVDKDERTKSIEDEEIARLLKDQRDEIKIIKKSALRKLERLLAKKKSAKPVKDGKKILIKKGGSFPGDILAQLAPGQWMDIEVQGKVEVTGQIREIWENYHEQIELVQMVFEDKIARLKKGDELPPGVIKMVKVYLAVKRKLSVGDKMAGRHGNKGVVSRVLPEEDMPYFADGAPVDIVLNPLGVPSRMNVGQVLETHLGWAAKGLGEQLAQLLEAYKSQETVKAKLRRLYSKQEFKEYFAEADEAELKSLIPHYKEGFHLASPVFDGAEEGEIREFLKEGGLPELGQATLYDGRNGEPFHSEVTVGVMYMMKLHHLVDDKLHARSIGPYSLVTQQPLGGKAQFGGQRLGEMEVWAMEAYGAAYALQEFLTVKSDDVAGRTRMYEKIVKGENTLEAGLPESFNVLVKELQALGLDVRLLEDADS